MTLEQLNKFKKTENMKMAHFN